MQFRLNAGELRFLLNGVPLLLHSWTQIRVLLTLFWG